MATLPPGWETDIAVLELGGSTVEDRGDHLVVRTPQIATFHWGNYVLVTDPEAVDGAARWLATFHDAFPAADWVAIGLARMPRDAAAWAAEGVELGLDDVLTTTTQPRQTAPPAGYVARRLVADDDWEQLVARGVADNEQDGVHEPTSHARFVRERMQSQRALSEREAAAFFGAFADGELVAELGIVRCGATARFQTVATDSRHRRRGLASHLLGVAAAWAAERGCARWVIVTEATNPAGRVYRAAGFAPDAPTVQAYRPPPR